MATSLPAATPALALQGATDEPEGESAQPVDDTLAEGLGQDGDAGSPLEDVGGAASDDVTAQDGAEAEEATRQDGTDEDAVAPDAVEAQAVEDAVAPDAVEAQADEGAVAPVADVEPQEQREEAAVVGDDAVEDTAERVLAVSGTTESDKLATQSEVAQGPNLAKAQARFPSAKQVFGVTTVQELTDALARIKKEGLATASNPAIVYAASGTYALTSTLSVPDHVILVGEADTKFVAEFASPQPMVKLWGSLYGGTYDGQGRTKGTSYDGRGKANQGVRIQVVAFSGVNGVIQGVKILGVTKHGILADGRGTTNIQIVDCTVTDCGMNGVNIHDEPHVTVIKGCTFSNNGYDAAEGCSGINMRHSTIERIENCIIQNNADKGISTNADADPSIKVPGCSIGTISGCNISYNKINGVYLKPLCHIDHFFNNTMRGNPDGIACVAHYQGATGSSYIKDVRNNTFDSNANSQVYVRAKGAVVEIGANNTMTGGKNAVVVLDGASLNVYGNGNVIQKSKGAGIDVNGGTATITGSGTKIQNNKTHGFYVNKGTVTIKGSKTLVSGNKKFGICLFKKSTVAISGASTTVQKSGANNVNMEGGSKLTISSKGTKIGGAGNIGVSMKGKSTFEVKGANTAISSSKKFGFYVTGGSKLVVSGTACKVESNGNHGIYLQKSSAKITGKKVSISKNKGSGIAASEKSTVTLASKSGSIKSNKGFGVFATGKSKVTVKKAKLSKNKRGATYAAEGGRISKK